MSYTNGNPPKRKVCVTGYNKQSYKQSYPYTLFEAEIDESYSFPNCDCVTKLNRRPTIALNDTGPGSKKGMNFKLHQSLGNVSMHTSTPVTLSSHHSTEASATKNLSWLLECFRRSETIQIMQTEHMSGGGDSSSSRGHNTPKVLLKPYDSLVIAGGDKSLDCLCQVDPNAFAYYVNKSSNKINSRYPSPTGQPYYQYQQHPHQQQHQHPSYFRIRIPTSKNKSSTQPTRTYM
eukprot:m.226499 g.226499  ORF g.226499 m.226499 type:complete len:233 (-) comp33493_c4_seq2:1001-1699(-)